MRSKALAYLLLMTQIKMNPFELSLGTGSSSIQISGSCWYAMATY